ncbi:MAG: hypothetical protein ISS41_08485 [Candidatus Aminicenantes bacterium]|nr:hypothetical protein [Candidatus Aminicenantes bacterium]MBL7083653.1 hypothetical protein [Candidatus Aminicenantes bacterium]
MPENEEKNLLLGFLSLFETENEDGKLGAILITDHQGVPQEFRCTYPIKPTTIQKPLYGNTLEPYIGTKLCGIPLIQSIQSKPSIIIVDKEFLLDVREESPCPLIFLHRAGEVMEVESSDSKKSTLKKERIESSTGRYQPIIIMAHSDYEEDRDTARKILEEIFSHLDPYEPFERMNKAVEVLGKQDNRFQ